MGKIKKYKIIISGSFIPGNQSMDKVIEKFEKNIMLEIKKNNMSPFYAPVIVNDYDPGSNMATLIQVMVA